MKLISLIKKIFQERDASRLEEEIQAIIDAGEEDGLIDPQSGEMIQSILEFLQIGRASCRERVYHPV